MFRYIYGPVASWRLGNSLGIDLLSKPYKVCPFDCVYCQLGKTQHFSIRRKIFVPTGEIIKEINSLPQIKIDYITFSGSGEPTLAKNLGEVINKIRSLRKEKIAILTNSALLHREDVIKDLLLIDFVVLKLDAHSEEMLKKINNPAGSISFSVIFESISKFRKIYSGRLGIQIMFFRQNKPFAKDIAEVISELKPDEVQICTPIRPCPVEPLSEKDIAEIKKYFVHLHTVAVYDRKQRFIQPINITETLKRRGELNNKIQ